MQEPPKRRRATRGTCALCRKEFGKRAILRHLETHQAERETAPGLHAKRFHLLVEGAYGPEYWLHLDVRADATLKKLDNFLRGIWLECCGHLSQFTLDASGWGRPTVIGMSRTLEKTLTPGMTLLHEYDFGSTTELKLRVLAEHDGDPARDAVLLLARNIAPPRECEKCGAAAVWLGVDEEGEFRELCAECGGEDAEEWLLPVVNSPRAGVCGYTGEED